MYSYDYDSYKEWTTKIVSSMTTEEGFHVLEHMAIEVIK